MKKILLLTLSFPLLSHAEFICDGNALYSNKVQNPINLFQSPDDCKAAVQHSKNGFICHGNILYADKLRLALTIYPSPQDCLQAVKDSQ